MGTERRDQYKVPDGRMTMGRLGASNDNVFGGSRPWFTNFTGYEITGTKVITLGAVAIELVAFTVGVRTDRWFEAALPIAAVGTVVAALALLSFVIKTRR